MPRKRKESLAECETSDGKKLRIVEYSGDLIVHADDDDSRASARVPRVDAEQRVAHVAAALECA